MGWRQRLLQGCVGESPAHHSDYSYFLCDLCVFPVKTKRASLRPLYLIPPGTLPPGAFHPAPFWPSPPRAPGGCTRALPAWTPPSPSTPFGPHGPNIPKECANQPEPAIAPPPGPHTLLPSQHVPHLAPLTHQTLHTPESLFPARLPWAILLPKASFSFDFLVPFVSFVVEMWLLSPALPCVLCSENKKRPCSGPCLSFNLVPHRPEPFTQRPNRLNSPNDPMIRRPDDPTDSIDQLDSKPPHSCMARPAPQFLFLFQARFPCALTYAFNTAFMRV